MGKADTEGVASCRGYQPWTALLAFRNRQSAPVVVLWLFMFGFMFIARLFGWIEHSAPTWQRWTTHSVIFIIFLAAIVVILTRLRKLPHQYFIGRCLSCGKPRAEYLERCTFCGSDFGPQDWYIRNTDSRPRRPAPMRAILNRQYIQIVMIAVFNALLGAAFVLWLRDPPTDLMVPTQNFRLFILAMATVLILSNAIMIVALISLRRRLFRRLVGCCLNCGQPVDLQEESCAKCDQSLLPQRAHCCTNPSLNFLLGNDSPV